jgi:hypothetical protein
VVKGGIVIARDGVDAGVLAPPAGEGRDGP